MSTTLQNNEEAKGSRRALFLIIGIVSLLLIGGVIYLATRPSTGGGTAGPPRLQGEGVLRAGSPDFEKYRALITVDEKDALQSTTALGGLTMDLKGTVRNFTGHTLTGLEMRGVVVDLDKKPVKERTVIIIPDRSPELYNNKTLPVNIRIEGFNKDEAERRANYDLEVTAIRISP
jgi:hypothetical protein